MEGGPFIKQKFCPTENNPESVFFFSASEDYIHSATQKTAGTSLFRRIPFFKVFYQRLDLLHTRTAFFLPLLYPNLSSGIDGSHLRTRISFFLPLLYPNLLPVSETKQPHPSLFHSLCSHSRTGATFKKKKTLLLERYSAALSFKKMICINLFENKSQF